jgi:hypothetical protein
VPLRPEAAALLLPWPPSVPLLPEAAALLPPWPPSVPLLPEAAALLLPWPPSFGGEGGAIPLSNFFTPPPVALPQPFPSPPGFLRYCPARTATPWLAATRNLVSFQFFFIDFI